MITLSGILVQLLLLLGYLSVTVFCEIEYNTINEDGSYTFRHSNDDIGGYYHSASGSPDNVVRGRYGSRNPATGQVEEVVYSAGPRGFRVNGPKIHRKMDLAQFPPGPIGTPDDPLADPFDVPTYSFNFRTPDQSRTEDNDATGRVRGLYSYIDDVGERHSVRYAAGAGTGFEVSNSVPDSPGSVGYTAPLYKAHPKTRGKMSVQRGPNGSYKLIAAGPDHRRAESRGSDGLVRGTYSYLDDKGVQRTVEYIAGAGIGYRVVQNRVGPGTHINPSVSEFRLSDPDFKLANDFGRGAGGGARGGIGSVVSGSDGGRGGEYLKTAGSSRVRPKDGIRPGNEDDEEDNEDVDPSPDDGSSIRRGGSSTRVKTDRIGSAETNSRGGTRYRGGAGEGGLTGETGDEGSPINDNNDGFETEGSSRSSNRGLSKPGGRGSQRPSSNRNSLNGNDTPRNRNRNRNRDRISIGTDSSSSGTDSTAPSRPSLSTSLTSDGYNYDAPASPNNYDLKDDDVGSLPPLITANRKILEVDRERDWVERHRDSTVIKNVGKWYIGLPPGQSVRAHVQNIDVLPLGGRRIPSPSEALRQDEIADMVASMENGSSYSSSS